MKQKCEMQASDKCDIDLVYGYRTSYETGKKIIYCRNCPSPKDAGSTDTAFKIKNSRITHYLTHEDTGQTFGIDGKTKKAVPPEEDPYRGDQYGWKRAGLLKDRQKKRKSFYMGANE